MSGKLGVQDGGNALDAGFGGDCVNKDSLTADYTLFDISSMNDSSH